MIKYDPALEKCKVCGSSDIFKFHQSDTNAQIFKCKYCKIQFMNPQYTDEYLVDYYSTYIRDETDLEMRLKKSHSYCLSLIEQCLPTKGKLLDIGSGNGFLITMARERGWQPTGHEVDCKSAKDLMQKTGINILCGDIFNLNIVEKFDAVSMLHVLEHLKRPEEYLQQISRVLNKNGILFITLPNIQSRSSLFKLLLEKIKLKTKNVAAYYDTDHHLWYYSPSSIRFFLEKHRFQIMRIYSGENINLGRSKLINLVDEKILSRLFWHSSMGVIAKKF